MVAEALTGKSQGWEETMRRPRKPGMALTIRGQKGSSAFLLSTYCDEFPFI